MLQKFRANNTQGFTLIELMIVIAIIGILAAIAIPNFISYRDKSFCSAAESDAQTIASAVASYFSVPSNTSVSDGSLESDSNGNTHVRAELSNDNTWDVVENDDAIEITVTEVNGRCPDSYKDSMTAADNPTGYWSGDDYIKIMSM